jgi:hypothetical protein
VEQLKKRQKPQLKVNVKKQMVRRFEEEAFEEDADH